MCGISALFSIKKSSKILPELLRLMTNAIDHRGPDGEGYALFRQGDLSPIHTLEFQGDIRAALGHKRLAILDLSPAGHQPMATDDGRFWLTYNGEIYNYIELRQELRQYGYHFVSESDTEVLIKAYQEWGKGCLARFNGMFSFVIYDSLKKRFFAARDRFGIKPLYYWISPDGVLAFASEIKQFTYLPGWKAKMNHQKVYDFLNWGMKDHTDDTLFETVKQLRGGCYVEGGIGSANFLRQIEWYQLRPNPFEGCYEEAVENFTNLLKDSIRIRLRADVDVGSCLSGGLDSSSIVCFANGLLKENSHIIRQKTFSACSKHKEFDESHYVDHVVRFMDVESHAVFPCPDQLENLVKELVWIQDEPYSSTSIYAQWLVFDSASKNKIKVMLDGQGADEQLAGYDVFLGSHLNVLFRSFKWLKLIQEMFYFHRASSNVNPVYLLGNHLLPDSLRNSLRLTLGKPTSNPYWMNQNKLEVFDHSPVKKTKSFDISELSIMQLTQTNLPMLLHYEDRNSMAHSVESRTPFLDYRLVEFVLGLPTEFKLSKGVTKRVLRSSSEGVIPESVRTRTDKMGFVTAEEMWLRKQRPDLFRTWIYEAIESSDGIISDHAKTVVERMISGKIKFDYLPWRLISFGHWIKKFSVSR